MLVSLVLTLEYIKPLGSCIDEYKTWDLTPLFVVDHSWKYVLFQVTVPVVWAGIYMPGGACWYQAAGTQVEAIQGIRPTCSAKSPAERTR